MALTAKIVVETDPAMMGIVASIAVLLAFLPPLTRSTLCGTGERELRQKYPTRIQPGCG
jgi:hypothetical protein